MGFRWSEVQILSPRPIKSNGYETTLLGIDRDISKLANIFSEAAVHE